MSEHEGFLVRTLRDRDHSIHQLILEHEFVGGQVYTIYLSIILVRYCDTVMMSATKRKTAKSQPFIYLYDLQRPKGLIQYNKTKNKITGVTNTGSSGYYIKSYRKNINILQFVNNAAIYGVCVTI